MLPDDTRAKIKNIAAGVVLEGQPDHCTTVRNFLCSGFPTSRVVKKNFESQLLVKEEQVQRLEIFCKEHGLWLDKPPNSENYLTRGGEARIYLFPETKSVVKLNDAVYYATWLEFFNSVVLHNLIFTNTQYELNGMTRMDGSLYAVLKQPFIIADGQAELQDISKLLSFNGFVNTRRNDYMHSELGLILEDMHDENVLVNSEILFFIDTVFYTVDTTEK